MDGSNNNPEIHEGIVKSVLYHQTTSAGAESIRQSGFKRGLRGAGHDGPLRGIFLKETSELLTGAGIGQAQLEVDLSPDTHLLDLRNEPPCSFVRSPDLAGLGSQDYALAGWLERNGYKELAENYYDAVNLLYRDNPERLNKLWPQIEQILREKGLGGVKYLDHYLEGDKKGETFPSVVVFNPEALTLK